MLILVLWVLVAGFEHPKRMTGLVSQDECVPISIALVGAGEKHGWRVLRAECKLRDDRKDEA